jgi:hypothetical protein
MINHMRMNSLAATLQQCQVPNAHHQQVSSSRESRTLQSH